MQHNWLFRLHHPALHLRRYQSWEAESVDAAREKLKMRLLRRMDKTGLLRVNFDPLLTRLLREVRYFLLYTGKVIELPEGALALFFPSLCFFLSCTLAPFFEDKLKSALITCESLCSANF